MPTEPTKADPPKHKRPRFQFRLRTLLIFTLICAVASAWLAHRMEQKGKEREAVAAISKVGGLVFYDYQVDSSGKPNHRAIPPGPDWPRGLFGEDVFCEVDNVDFTYANENWTDGLANLKALPKLRTLNLQYHRITDAGLEHLKGLSQLRELCLAVTNVTDAEVNELQQALPNCKIIR